MKIIKQKTRTIAVSAGGSSFCLFFGRELLNCHTEKSKSRNFKIIGSESNNLRAAAHHLTIILRNRAEYRLLLSRRGRWPSWLKSGDIPQD